MYINARVVKELYYYLLATQTDRFWKAVWSVEESIVVAVRKQPPPNKLIMELCLWIHEATLQNFLNILPEQKESLTEVQSV